MYWTFGNNSVILNFFWFTNSFEKLLRAKHVYIYIENMYIISKGLKHINGTAMGI